MQAAKSSMDTSVKRFSNDTGISTITPVAGAMIALLKSALVTGVGLQVVTSFEVVSGVGELRFAQPFAGLSMCVVDVQGCADASYNGEYKILDVQSNRQLVKIAMNAPDGVVQGAAITAKLPGAGWQVVWEHETEPRVVFKTTAPEGGLYYEMIDAAGVAFYIRGHQTFDEGAGVGGGSFPTSTSGLGWIKGAAAGSRWDLVADSQSVLFAVAGAAASAGAASLWTQGRSTRGFGALVPYSTVDAYAHFVCGRLGVPVIAASNTEGQGNLTGSWSTYPDGIALACSADGLTQAPTGTCEPVSGGNDANRSGQDGRFGTVAAAKGPLHVCQKFIRDTTASYPRGVVPGLLHLPFSSVDVARPDYGVMEFGGRMCLSYPAFHATLSTSSGSVGQGVIDVEGPWR